MSVAAAESAPRVYPCARVKGMAPWTPRDKTRALLEHVDHVLDEYAPFLPLTLRQIFYRLVALMFIVKSGQEYERLGEVLNRARRAGRIPFNAIRDDGASVNVPGGFSGLPHFWAVVRAAAARYHRDRSGGQQSVLELWVESSGMVPQAARVAHHYGAGVYSSGGFDSLTFKHDAAQRFLERDRATVVLHVGDYDASGLSIFDSAADDIATMIRDLDTGRLGVEFRRIAVTPSQITKYGLPEAEPKKLDKRGSWTGGTVQAEALPPDVLASEMRATIESLVDLDVLASVIHAEQEEHAQLNAELAERGEA